MTIKRKPKVLVLRTAGTNCDVETAFAFESVGAVTEKVHINRLVSGEKKLNDYQILALPGGFSYGDDIASGKVLANEIRFKLEDDFRKFIKRGNLIIGICNGFQVLVKAGLLPNVSGKFTKIESSLSLNDSAKFEDRWVYLKHGSQNKKSVCVWAKDMDDVIFLPVAHGEGKFIPKDDKVLEQMKKNGQIVFSYCNRLGLKEGYPVNPNGSTEDIAGICDPTGRVFGLMPHPERHIQFTQHPFWTRLSERGEGHGLEIFRNGVDFIRKS